MSRFDLTAPDAFLDPDEILDGQLEAVEREAHPTYATAARELLPPVDELRREAARPTPRRKTTKGTA